MLVDLPQTRWLQLLFINVGCIFDHYSYNRRDEHASVIQGHSAV